MFQTTNQKWTPTPSTFPFHLCSTGVTCRSCSAGAWGQRSFFRPRMRVYTDPNIASNCLGMGMMKLEKILKRTPFHVFSVWRLESILGIRWSKDYLVNHKKHQVGDRSLYECGVKTLVLNDLAPSTSRLRVGRASFHFGDFG